MKPVSIALASLVTLLSASTVFAHSAIESISPANDASLETAPNTLNVNFKKPARILKVVMTHTAGGVSNEKRLVLSSRKPVKHVELAPDFMGSGQYKVEWRALGSDGHVITGDFSFEILGT